jgi:membrane-associated protein
MWDIFREFFKPTSIISHGGLVLLLFVIFAETGLFIGFFLPGDYLVFISGLFCATKPSLLQLSIAPLILSLCVAAILGNIVGYWFGKRVGPALFKREDALLFKKRHVSTTRDFYAKYGGMTLLLGRFIPIIRTFAPILAGVIAVGFRRFMFYNILGAILWIGLFSLSGYYLGRTVPGIEEYLAYIVIGLIIITAIPVLITWRKERKTSK